MTIEEMQHLFHEYCDDFLVDGPRTCHPTRSDLNVFMLLDRLIPGKANIVACAEHDQIWLETDVNQLAQVITSEQVRELIQCGVLFREEDDSLVMQA